MGAFEDIEAAIGRLPRDQLLRLLERLRARYANEWDRQIEEDVAAGLLDDLAAEALAEHHAGKIRPFPEDEQPGDR